MSQSLKKALHLFKHDKADTHDESGTGTPTTSGEASPRRPSRSSSPVKCQNPLSAAKNGIADKLHMSDTHARRISEDHPSRDGPLNHEGEPYSKNQARKHEQAVAREERRTSRQHHEEELQQKRRQSEERAEREETPEQRAKYTVWPVNIYAGQLKGLEFLDISTISASLVGKSVGFRARIQNLRKMSAHLVFFVFRQQTSTIQGVMQEQRGISQHMVRWAEHLPLETIVYVKGRVQEVKAKQHEVIGATIHDAEIAVEELHVVSKVDGHMAFSVQDAEISQTDLDGNDTRHVISDRARLSNRILDLRTTTSQSIFRIQSTICNTFRAFLDARGFVEIHTPKLQAAATESGASVFKVDYFGRPAFLAQSPQLAKQMCIAADFKRVYEIGPVFRAENSNTHRHMTEYTGLDLEMAIDEHYHEALRMIDSVFKAIWKGIYEKHRHEIEIVKHHFPHEDLVWLEETPILPFHEGIRMLNESGHRQENGEPLPENEDLHTRDEIALGQLVKEKYQTDYYILDKFPSSARPFYTMPDPSNSDHTNSFDIFLRGQEILSGGQRIHDAVTLKKNMEAQKMDPSTMEEYVNGFEWGAPPHGGGGIGLERMLMLLLKLGDIRHASLWPRDPKSLPAKPVMKQLRHPEASTLHPPWEGKDRAAAHIEFQPLEKLIANYGDASNTSWLEERTNIWRDSSTGSAIGFVPNEGFAITVGDPLCHVSQYTKIISSYLAWLKKDRGLKPLWVLCGQSTEEVLATRFNWRTFSVAAEQRLDPTHNPAEHDNDVQRKTRHAQKEGITIKDYPLGEAVPQEVREKIDRRVEDWVKGRKGKQVHLTEIHPWQDAEHRSYYYAVDREGTIAALVVLAQLSPEHGWQVKYSLDFPGAPSGTIEHVVMHALKRLSAAGETNVTFGGGASNKFTPGHNLKGGRVKVLSRAYQTIAHELKLTNKSEFREKLGAHDDPIFVCYPPHGLGPRGVHAILSFFEDENEE